MITIKTKNEIKTLREGGARLAHILNEVAKLVKPGVSTAFLNEQAQKLIEESGDKAAFLQYTPKGASRPYPASLCVSINDEVVHGIPNEEPRILREGDIVSLDLGLIHKKLFTDHAVTVAVGTISEKAKKLIDVTKKALDVGIKAAKAGKKTGDIGYAIETYVKPYKFGIIEELSGHGVGYAVHEDPFVPNFGIENEGVLLKPGMVIAIEPMLSLGSQDIVLKDDGYTYTTRDGSLSAHFEHTIVITDGEPEILTEEK
jgi:methionyl aminopeptidase